MAALAALCREHAEFEQAGHDAKGHAERLAAALFCDPPRLHAWTGVVGHELVGYATASREYSTWSAGEYLHMDCLFVRASARGAGLGAALLQAVIDSAREGGIADIQWQTPAWNVDAARFYRRHGATASPKLRFHCRAANIIASHSDGGST
jgi:GNAT superfamily N-acetyltransferase